jgi:hypothetical protein
MKLKSIIPAIILALIALGSFTACDHQGPEQKAVQEAHKANDQAIDAAANARKAQAQIDSDAAAAKAAEAQAAAKELSDARARDEAARRAAQSK